MATCDGSGSPPVSSAAPRGACRLCCAPVAAPFAASEFVGLVVIVSLPRFHLSEKEQPDAEDQQHRKPVDEYGQQIGHRCRRRRRRADIPLGMASLKYIEEENQKQRYDNPEREVAQAPHRRTGPSKGRGFWLSTAPDRGQNTHALQDKADGNDAEAREQRNVR